MKKYSIPEIEIISFVTNDIITLSANDPCAEYDDVGRAPSGWF